MHWRCLQVKGQSTTSVIHTDRKRLERHLIYLPWNNITRKGKEEKEKGVKLCEITGKLMPRLSCSLVLTKHDCNLSTHRVFTQTRARQCATKLTCAQLKNISASFQSFLLITAAGKLTPSLLGKGFLLSCQCILISPSGDVS